VLTAGTIALSVREPDAQKLEAALHAQDAMTRATAARVVAVRGLVPLVPALRDAAEHETDPAAASEEVRALGLLGEPADVDAAIAVAAKFPPHLDRFVADGVARRGGHGAVDLYFSKLRTLRERGSFFQQAFWGHAEAITPAAARLVGAKDVAGWKALLVALIDASAALSPQVGGAALGSSSEDIRTETVWYLVRGYATDPSVMPQHLREVLAAQTEVSSDREDFGREILRRMLGGQPKDDDRWLRWLDSKEADDILVSSSSMYDFFTMRELAARKQRCGVVPGECPMPPPKSGSRVYPSAPVNQPDYLLPDVLPPGLADAIMTETRCGEQWIGVAPTTVDSAGRLQAADLSRLGLFGNCRLALDTILRLALARNESVRSPLATGILLVHAKGEPLCIDSDLSPGPRHVGGTVKAPVVLRRVEPIFPASARQTMGYGSSAIVIVEAVISKTGCVRSVKLRSQSPFGELNAAALLAITRWKFVPGRLDGQPVDVIFNLTINFKIP